MENVVLAGKLRRTPWTVCEIDTSSCASGADRSRKSTPFTTVKMPALTPMPRASVTTATAVNVGFLRKVREP